MAKDKSRNLLDKLCISVKGTPYSFKSKYEEMVLKNFIERALQLVDIVYCNEFG